MKKLILSQLFFAASLFCSEAIVPFDASKHIDAVVEIGMQNPEQFFPGYTKLASIMSEDVAKGIYKTEFEKSLKDAKSVTHVLTVDDNVIGLVTVKKDHEATLEDIKAQCEALGQPYNENMVLAMMPTIKRTKAEVEEYILLESVAVDKNNRKKGYGKKLVQFAQEYIKKTYTDLHKIILNVSCDNDQAIKLYEAQDFIKSMNQNVMFVNLGITQYEKTV